MTDSAFGDGEFGWTAKTDSPSFSRFWVIEIDDDGSGRQLEAIIDGGKVSTYLVKLLDWSVSIVKKKKGTVRGLYVRARSDTTDFEMVKIR